MNLKEIRLEASLTQEEASKLLGISRRTYITYEKDFFKLSKQKQNFIIEALKEYNKIDETHGLLTIEQIIDICHEVFKEYEVNYCYLFGSYAKGKASETSDIDLLISTNVTGLDYFGLIEELREKLHKKVDLFDDRQLKDNFTLTQEILKNGIKIYG